MRKLLMAITLTSAFTISLNPAVSAEEQFNKSLVDLAKFNGPVQSIVELPNGQIMVGGDFTKVNGTVKLGMVRLNSDGSIDTSFTPQVPGPDIPGTLDLDTRKLTFDKSSNAKLIPNYFTRVWSILPDADGYLVVADNANYYNYHFGFLRLNHDGTVDNTYRAKYTGNIGFAPIRITKLPSGKIVLGGLAGSNNGIRIAVLDKNGDFDSSFSPNPSVPRDSNGGFLGMGFLGDESILVITGQPKLGVIGDPNNPCVAVLKYSKTGDSDTAWEKKFAMHSVSGLAGPGNIAEPKYVGRANSFAQLPDGKLLVSVGFGSKPINAPEKSQETCYGGTGSFVLINNNGEIDQTFKDTTLNPQTTFSANYDGDKILVQGLVNFSASGGPTLIEKTGNLDSRLKVDAKKFYDESFFQSAGIFSNIGRYILVSGNATNNLIAGNQENYVLRKIWLNPISPIISNFVCTKLKCSISISPSPQATGLASNEFEVDINTTFGSGTYKISSETYDLPPRKPNESLSITARAINSSGKSFDSKNYTYQVPQFVPQKPTIKLIETSKTIELNVGTMDDGGAAPSAIKIYKLDADGNLLSGLENPYIRPLVIQKSSQDYQVKLSLLNSVGESELSDAVTIKAFSQLKTIYCQKGKLIKKVISVKPVCPVGYKKR